MSRKSALPRDAWLAATARGASLLGDEVAYVALAWRLKGHGPSAVMALTLALMVPQVVAAPWAGLIADRVSAKRIVTTVTLVQALICLALVNTSLVLSVVGVALLSLGSAVVNPAMGALAPRLVERELLPRLMGLAGTFTSLGAILGPAIGGTLVAISGTRTPLVLDALSFAAYAILIRSLRTDRIPEPKAPEQRTKREWAAGWRVLRSDSILSTLQAVLICSVLGIGALNVAEVFFITKTLQGNSFVYGILGLMFGGGNLIGAVLFPRLKVAVQQRPMAAMCSAWLLAFGILTLGMSRSVWLAALACLIVGVGNGTINMLFGILMADRVPDEVRGRFGAVFGSAITTSSITSMLLAGFFLHKYAPETVITAGGCLAVAACSIGLPVLARAVRREARQQMQDSMPQTTIGT